MTALDQYNPLAARRLCVGAESRPQGGTAFRVWAPETQAVRLELATGESLALRPEPQGYHAAFVQQAGPGTRYRFSLDGKGPYPDPASRFQPEGPHGPSEVVDPTFPWTDGGWTGLKLPGQVFMELHVGSFTPEGSWAAASEKLPSLAETGITAVEVMPVAEFPGRFGWGYDGVGLFAPTRLYGSPDDMRSFVDRAHALGIGVLLDVVYNHLGPSGNYLACYSKAFFTDRYENEWGKAINFDRPDCRPVRDFFLANVRYWIDEFRLDGLRLDATQSIFDTSPRHILREMTETAVHAAGGRNVLIVGENEPQRIELLHPASDGGPGLDALWNDDFHHSAMVAATGRREAYYVDHRGAPQEFVSAAKQGFLFQGQLYSWQGKRRGTPAPANPGPRLVNYLQNHDQMANSGRGERLHRITSPGRYRALTALLLLLPGTPMLFQGQEFAADAPFLYFADHEPELAAMVHKGRRDFLAQFPSLAAPAMADRLPAPEDPATFAACVLDWAQRAAHAESLALHTDLLMLRRHDPVIAGQAAHGIDGAVLGEAAFCLRWSEPEENDRVLVVNLGAAIDRPSFPEPLLAPPVGARWHLAFSTENPRYGGLGTPPPDTESGWRLPAESALLLRPVRG